jgi:serine/threonine protein kinase
VNSPNPCLPESAFSSIADNRINDAELRIYERHLEFCERCREQLEAQSADAGLWQSVRDFLSDDQFDQQRFDCGGQPGRDASEDSEELLKFLGPTDDPHMLGRLGAYEVAGIIGAGGMGVVVKAFEPSLARFVALKVLAPRFWRDEQSRERFAREARAAASIVHENVIEIYGVHEVNGIPFFAMPYLRGETLEARIKRQGPLRIEEILRVAMQVAAGVAAAHAQGLVHRDVKPANILLGSGAERVRITDFGIAHLQTEPRITQSGLIAGTPQYMSPEQVRGETLDGRSDLFSLGSVMYAMCTGRPPFQADSNYQLLHQVVSADRVPVEDINPAVPDWLAAIVAKLHSPLPADRYQSAEELAGDLQQCLASLQQPTTVSRPRSVSRLEGKYRRKRRSPSRRLFLGGFLMAVCILTIIGLLAFQPGVPAADSVDVRGQVVNEAGKPVPDVTVAVVRKTWPNNRYRQEMLKTTTDKDGRFAIEKFAEAGKQYAFLVTVISDKHLMTSEYRLVRDGAQQDRIVLPTEKSQPVTIRFQDSSGKPVANVRALPFGRMTKNGTEYLSYAQQVYNAGVEVDENGKVPFGSWKPGEQGSLVYLVNNQIETAEFSVPEDRTVTVEVSPSPSKPASGQPIYVAGQVVGPDGKPLAKLKVLAIQKTWPNNRYRQDALSATTDAQGKFRFDKFATSGNQYAFLLTVVADGYAMVSEYQLIRDGSQKPPVTLKVEPAKPVTVVVKEANGRPAEGVEISPAERIVDEQTTYLLYSAHMKDTAKMTSASGEVSFSFWQPGESGSVYFNHKDQRGEIKFKVSDDRRVTITLP